MSFLSRISRMTCASVLPLIVSACALAPGMQFDPQASIDADDPSVVPTVTNITPAIIKQQRESRLQTSGEAYKQLMTAVAPYRIGPADVLSIIVWNHPELVIPNLTYTIGETAGVQPTGPGLSSQAVPGFAVGDDGNIQFPFIGAFRAQGLTTSELQQRLTAALQPYIRSPQVTISVVAYRSKRVFVEGPVALAGVKPITDVPMSLAEVLGEANGVQSGVGDLSQIELLRNGKRFRLNLGEMAAEGVNTAQIMLKDRDVIRIVPQTYNQVFMTGEVGKPAGLPMHDGRLTLSDALASVQGVDPNSGDPAAVYVIRATDDPARPEVFRLNGKSPVAYALAEHFELKAKDVVYVDATGLTRWSRMINQIVPTTTGSNAIRGTVN